MYTEEQILEAYNRYREVTTRGHGEGAANLSLEEFRKLPLAIEGWLDPDASCCGG